MSGADEHAEVSTLRMSFGRLCRDTRARLDVSQRELAASAALSPSYLADIESGRANATLDVAQRLANALGIDVSIASRQPIVIGNRGQRDLLHARCSGYVDRRLRTDGWLTRREVEIVHGRSHGWIDLLAFDPRTGLLVVVEIKTALDDLGSIERQVAWYERSAMPLATAFGWRPTHVLGWLLILATDEADQAIQANRELLSTAFPARAGQLRAVLHGDVEGLATPGRGLALVDPASRRRAWLIPSRSDGRRSPAPYRDRTNAVVSLSP